MRPTTQRMTRKTAIAVALLGATLILPGSAVASHNPGNHRNPYTCTPSTPEPAATACPAFEASSLFRIQNPVKASPSSLSIEFGQADLRMPVMKADYFLPRGWRFALSELDPAVNAANAPATSCADIYNADGSIASNSGRARAELVSADTGMLVQIARHRTSSEPSDDEEFVSAVLGPGSDAPPAEYGYRVSDPITGNPRRNPSVAFLNWDGTTARFCYQHRNNQAASVKGTLPATFIGSFTLTRLADDSGFDWRISLDTSHFFNHPNADNEIASMLKHTISFNSISAGNRNRHPITGEPSKVTFSRTPLDADLHEFRAVLYSCSGAMNQADPTGCAGGTYSAPIVIDQTVHIAPSPDKIRHDFARLTNPATSLLQSVSSFTATWNQPAPIPGVEVMGYALVVAKPNSQKSRKFFRLITDDANVDFNATVCGPSGNDTACQFTVQFPTQSTDGSTVLTADGGYHFTLITIYKQDGRRTDGLCDGGVGDTGEGVTCPPNVAPLRANQSCIGGGCTQADKDNLQEPGIDSRRVLIRPETWPLIYGDSPAWLLLDYSKKKAEYIEWPTGGLGDPSKEPPKIRKAISNLIIGDNATGLGVFEFGTATNAGSTQNWLMTGLTEPLIGASGLYLEWNVKNPTIGDLGTILSGNAIAGWPEVDAFVFVGAP